MPEDLEHLSAYAQTRSNPYQIPWLTLCREVMGTRQREQLRRLISFRFRRHPSINLPEARLQAIENQIESRVRELMSL